MTEQSFCLQPFPSTSSLPDLRITSSIARRSNRLAIRYAIHGPLAGVTIPLPADMPARREKLWEETCFEFFLAVKNSSRYWEFNLSPAGDWNAYRFAGYREGMQEEPAFASLPFSVRTHSEFLVLALELDLAELVPADLALEVAVSAVIQTGDGGTTYWALAHSGPQADFHRRDSFIITL